MDNCSQLVKGVCPKGSPFLGDSKVTLQQGWGQCLISAPSAKERDGPEGRSVRLSFCLQARSGCSLAEAASQVPVYLSLPEGTPPRDLCFSTEPAPCFPHDSFRLCTPFPLSPLCSLASPTASFLWSTVISQDASLTFLQSMLRLL